MPQCSLCGKTEGDADKPSAGSRLYVCQACVAQANKVIEEELGQRPPEG